MQFFLYAIVGEHWTHHMGSNHGITTVNKKVMMDRFFIRLLYLESRVQGHMPNNGLVKGQPHNQVDKWLAKPRVKSLVGTIDRSIYRIECIINNIFKIYKII